jgi:pyruvate dehydrogenase E2 component (dihydrolipoamide acetyltransferase)
MVTLREFRLPDLGEGLTEAEVVRVLVAEGDLVREDQSVLVVETEKAQVELPTPHGGRVAGVHVRPGERVRVGAVLFTFGEAGTPPPAAAVSPAPPPARGSSRSPAGPPAPAAAPPPGLAPAATPATRRLARDLGVDLAVVRGTGPGGRITEDDVRAAAGPGRPVAPAAGAPPVPPPPAAPAAATAPSTAPLRPLVMPGEPPPLPRFEQWGPVEREPLRGVRRRSAEHLAWAWALVPHVTQHDEADVTDLDAMRRRLARQWEVDVTLTACLVRAVALVLPRHPRFNASLDHATGELVVKRYHHVGIATDTDRGLVVPVLRDADRKPLRALAVELAALVARTREGKATIEDLRGGSFTITNTGALGGTGATPIVNWPEVAILGVGRARPTPVVRDGHVVPRLVLPLSLGFDHRVIDGMEAARFSTDLVGVLEAPERLLLEP